MRSSEVNKAIEKRGGVKIRQRGSHRRYQATRDGVTRSTTVPQHSREVSPGTLRAIERQMEAVFGKGWLR